MQISEAVATIKDLTGSVVKDSQLFRWLSEVDGQLMLEFYNGDAFSPYVYPTDANAELLVPFPWDEAYIHYLEAKTYYTNGEYDRYDNSYIQYNKCIGDYRKYMQRKYSPIDPHVLETRGAIGGTPVVVDTSGPNDRRWWFLSAYASAVKHGYKGTEEEWLQEMLSGNAALIAEMREAVEAVANKVPNTRKINGKDLSQDRTLTAGDVGALSISGGTITGTTVNLLGGKGSIYTSEDSNKVNSALTAKGDSSTGILQLEKAKTGDSVDLGLYVTDSNGIKAGYRLYGTHNKPTAGDVGAPPVTEATPTTDFNTLWTNNKLTTYECKAGIAGQIEMYHRPVMNAGILISDGIGSMSQMYIQSGGYGVYRRWGTQENGVATWDNPWVKMVDESTTAMMLALAAEQEERLCLMEMGLN